MFVKHRSAGSTAVSSEAWAKLRVWASVAGRGRLLLSGSVAHASLETAVSRSGQTATAGTDFTITTYNDSFKAQWC